MRQKVGIIGHGHAQYDGTKKDKKRGEIERDGGREEWRMN
jgi:hypothetical protein